MAHVANLIDRRHGKNVGLVVREVGVGLDVGGDVFELEAPSSSST
jgi:hypothetical protein